MGRARKIQADGHCPDGQPHHWLINDDDIGFCRHCHEVRDFGTMMLRYLDKIIGRNVEKSVRGGLVSGAVRSQPHEVSIWDSYR